MCTQGECQNFSARSLEVDWSQKNLRHLDEFSRSPVRTTGGGNYDHRIVCAILSQIAGL